MKITLTPEGGTATELCSGDERCDDGTPFGASAVSVDETPGAELREFVGADRVQGEHVGCDRGTLSFRVNRVYKTVAAATAYAMAGHRSEPTAGALAVEEGGAATTVYGKCVVTSKRITQAGCCLAIQYTVEG